MHISTTCTTYQNNKIISHTWKLANIIPIPIPKPNKDMNIGTSYRPISLLLVIAKHWRRHYSRTSQTTSYTSPHNMASKATTLQAQHYTTQHKQHNRNRPQPKQTSITHNHCSTRHEQSIGHTQHTHTHT